MNAFQTVHRLLQAERALKNWTPMTYGAVVDLCPQFVLDDGQTTRDWAIVIQLLRLPGETPVAAAHRIATYVTLHPDLNRTPSLNRLDYLTAPTHDHDLEPAR